MEMGRLRQVAVNILPRSGCLRHQRSFAKQVILSFPMMAVAATFRLTARMRCPWMAWAFRLLVGSSASRAEQRSRTTAPSTAHLQVTSPMDGPSGAFLQRRSRQQERGPLHSGALCLPVTLGAEGLSGRPHSRACMPGWIVARTMLGSRCTEALLIGPRVLSVPPLPLHAGQAQQGPRTLSNLRPPINRPSH